MRCNLLAYAMGQHFVVTVIDRDEYSFTIPIDAYSSFQPTRAGQTKTRKQKLPL